MKAPLGTLLALAVCLTLVESSVKIYSPASLVNYYGQSSLKNSYANYGKVPYGTLLAGRVFYFKNNSNGCGKFTNAYLDPEGDPDNDVSPIVLVDRGGCSFVRKTRNIQELGGALALVVDSREGKDPEQVVMIDDGTGSSIAIPTILISKADGKRLKDEVERTEASNKVNADNREFVVLMVDFELESPDDRVEYDIWYTSGDHKALDFIRSMNPINKRLDKKVLMTPHMMVQTCGWCSASEIERNCISVDRTPYCAPPIRDSNLTGREALRQGLTEYCVYKEYHEEKPQAWWDYMDGIQECERERYRSECSDKALKQAGIDLHRVDRCLAKEQEILRAEHELWQASGIVYNPAVVINNRVYRGTLDANNVFKSICAGFNETPDVCFGDYDPAEGVRKESGSSIGTKTIIGLIIALVMINVMLIYCYRRYTKREVNEEMQLQISSMMSQYFALSDNKARPTPA